MLGAQARSVRPAARATSGAPARKATSRRASTALPTRSMVRRGGLRPGHSKRMQTTVRPSGWISPALARRITIPALPQPAHRSATNLHETAGCPAAHPPAISRPGSKRM